MPTDKKIESAHFKLFRRLAGEKVPDGPVMHSGTYGEPAPQGAPDFLIQAHRYIVGIEHRELLLPNKGAQRARAREGNIDEVLKMAQEFAELRGTNIARVSVLFGREVPVTDAGRRELARQMANLVHDRMPADCESVRLAPQDLEGILRRSVHSISLYRNDNIRPGPWFEGRGAFLSEDCIEVIQAAISKKAGRYVEYRKHCSECWLLLVSDSTRESSAMNPNEASLAHEYESPFERIYLLDGGMGRLHNLRHMPHC